MQVLPLQHWPWDFLGTGAVLLGMLSLTMP